MRQKRREEKCWRHTEEERRKGVEERWVIQERLIKGDREMEDKRDGEKETSWRWAIRNGANEEHLRERKPDFSPAATQGRGKNRFGREWQIRRERMCQEEEYCMARDAIEMHAMSLVPWKEAECMRGRARSKRGEDRKMLRYVQDDHVTMTSLSCAHTHTQRPDFIKEYIWK